MEHETVPPFMEDDDGFWPVMCSCGWKGGDAPDVETATDILMQHAYEAGQAEARE